MLKFEIQCIQRRSSLWLRQIEIIYSSIDISFIIRAHLGLLYLIEKYFYNRAFNKSTYLSV